MNRSSTPGRASGFTLLEVLVALAVLSIALAPTLNLAGINARSAARVQEKTYAHWVAMNLVTELQVADVWPDVGRLSGEETLGGRPWYWTVEVRATPDADVRRLDVAVRLDQSSSNSVANLVSFVGGPT